MEQGYSRLKAKMEAQYEALKSAYEASLIDLEESELDLQQAKDKQEKAFD